MLRPILVPNARVLVALASCGQFSPRLAPRPCCAPPSFLWILTVLGCCCAPQLFSAKCLGSCRDSSSGPALCPRCALRWDSSRCAPPALSPLGGSSLRHAPLCPRCAPPALRSGSSLRPAPFRSVSSRCGLVTTPCAVLPVAGAVPSLSAVLPPLGSLLCLAGQTALPARCVASFLHLVISGLCLVCPIHAVPHPCCAVPCSPLLSLGLPPACFCRAPFCLALCPGRVLPRALLCQPLHLHPLPSCTALSLSPCARECGPR